MDSADPIGSWRAIITTRAPWVLFRNDTCVVLARPTADAAKDAVDLLREWGPVHAGSSSADFSVISLGGELGWIVTSHHSDVFTRVWPHEIAPVPATEILVGLLGRSKRDQDAADLEVIHVESPEPTHPEARPDSRTLK